MPTSTITVSITSKKKTAVITGDKIALKESVSVTLKGYGSATPANLELAIQIRDTELATCTSFTDNGDSTCTGTLDLDQTALANAFAGYGNMATRKLNLLIWDTGNSELLVNDKINIMNNRYDIT